MLTDPFVAGRGQGAASASGGATPFADVSDAASAYAANGRKRVRTRCLRDNHKNCATQQLVRSALERVGCWLRRFANHRRQCDAGLEHRDQPRVRHRRRCRLSAVAAHHRRFCTGRRRHQLQRQWSRDRPFRPVPGRRLRASHGWAGLYLGGRCLWMAGHHHRPRRYDRGGRSAPGPVQRQCILGTGRGRLSLRVIVDGHRRHALCRRTIHRLRSAGIRRKRSLRRQHLCAELRVQECHRIARRVGIAHRQVLCADGFGPHPAGPLRLGA
jgi:hypothetical protein